MPNNTEGIILYKFTSLVCWSTSWWCIKLRIFRLRPAEWGGTTHPPTHGPAGSSPSASQLPPQKSENSGVVLIKDPEHSHKGHKVEDLLLTDPTKRRGGMQWAGGRAILHPGSQASRRWQGTKPLLFIWWLGQRSLIFHRLNCKWLF